MGKKLLVLFILLTPLFQSCDGGLEPIENSAFKETGFKGKVIFVGEWPTDVKLTYIVLFENPLLSALDFNPLNLKYVSLPIPFGSTEFSFSSEEALFGEVEAGEYAYFAVAQSTSETLDLNRSLWRVAGVYKSDNSSAEGNISIPLNETLEGIEIICDFDNPPNQPPGG
jgi:hypothetical protein